MIFQNPFIQAFTQFRSENLGYGNFEYLDKAVGPDGSIKDIKEVAENYLGKPALREFTAYLDHDIPQYAPNLGELYFHQAKLLRHVLEDDCSIDEAKAALKYLDAPPEIMAGLLLQVSQARQMSPPQLNE